MSDILLVDDRPNDLDGVRLLTLHRPERRNALSSLLVHALRAAVEDAQKDPKVRVVVITGSGDKLLQGVTGLCDRGMR